MSTTVSMSAEMVQELTPLIRKLSWQFPNRDEAFQDGWLGALQAWQKFDASHGAKFKTYAYVRILGAMKDGRRKQSYQTDRSRLMKFAFLPLKENILPLEQLAVDDEALMRLLLNKIPREELATYCYVPHNNASRYTLTRLRKKFLKSWGLANFI